MPKLLLALLQLDGAGLAVSCAATMESTRKPDRSNLTHTSTNCAHHNVCVKEAAKGPKGNKEQGKAVSRKLTSHFILAPLRPLWWGRRDPHLPPVGQTAGQHGGENVEVKIKG